jgi:hypothetical protein
VAEVVIQRLASGSIAMLGIVLAGLLGIGGQPHPKGVGEDEMETAASADASRDGKPPQCAGFGAC